MTATSNIILTNRQVEQKIKRIAYQIYETNSNEKEIVIAGISSSGYLLAKKLETVLKNISDLNLITCEVIVDKKNPLNRIEVSAEPSVYKNKSLVLVDDVLNSGTTLIYSIKHFLDVPLKRLKTAVLVDRDHKKYPVNADFKGISLSTSIKEHITVKFLDESITVFLE